MCDIENRKCDGGSNFYSGGMEIVGILLKTEIDIDFLVPFNFYATWRNGISLGQLVSIRRFCFVLVSMRRMSLQSIDLFLH